MSNESELNDWADVEAEFLLSESHMKEADTVLDWASRGHVEATHRLSSARAEMERVNHPQAGFSLVELMVTLAVMGTLAVMAVGSFSSFNSRAQVAEAFTVSETLQGDFKARYADDGKTPPQSLADLYGTGPAATSTQHVGRYISSTNLDGGVLVVTFGLSAAGDLDGSILTLEPFETVTGSLLWRCGSAAAPTDGLGAALNVAGTLSGSPITGTAVVTTVPDELLPRTCKVP